MDAKLTIYNHGNKLAARGFWHVDRASERWQQDKVYDAEGMFWTGKEWVARAMQVKIVAVFKMKWSDLQHKDWILHCDIFKTGNPAKQAYENAWKNWLKPASILLAMRLERIVVDQK